jgi:hypothetical protein
MDIASYVRGAYALQKNGLIAFGNMGFATWPPGFACLELMLIKLAVVPLPLSLFLLGTFLWAAVMFQVQALLRQVGGLHPAAAAAAPLLLLAVPFIRGFYLWDGILMSEPISTALFTIAGVDIWRRVATSSPIGTSRAVLLGVILALSVYIRAQFDLIFHALAFLTFVLLLTFKISESAAKLRDKGYVLKKVGPSLLVVFLVFEALILPYKAYLASKGNGFAMSNVTYIFESLWKTESWHVAHSAKFFSDGGGHSMSVIDREKYEEFELHRSHGEKTPIEEYKKAAFRVVLTQPMALLIYKWPYFWKAWNYEENALSSGFNKMLFIAIIITSISRIFQNCKQGMLETAYFLTFAGGATVFCFIVHFEPRYLLPIKLIGLLWLMLLISSIVTKNSPIKFRIR